MISTTRVTLEGPVPFRRGNCNVSHVHLPALPGIGRNLAARWFECDPEQGPLQAMGPAVRIHEVGSQVPPFDPEIIVRAVIPGKLKHFAGFRLGVALGALGQDREVGRLFSPVTGTAAHGQACGQQHRNENPPVNLHTVCSRSMAAGVVRNRWRDGRRTASTRHPAAISASSM